MGLPHHRIAALHLLLALAILCLGCAPGGGDDGTRVLVLGLDGMDPDAMDLLISEGKLPHFSELRRLGAYGKLRSQRPILSPIIWTTIATGQTPDRHGIGHFVTTTADGDQLPVTSQMRRVEAIWNIVSDADKSVATVGWWATWPPETVNGSVVSDHTSYHFMFEEGFTGGDDEIPKTHPPELMARIEPLLRRPADLTPAELEPFVDVPPEAYRREFDFQDDFAHFRWALATAQGYRDIGLELWRQDRPDLAMVYIEGTDSTSHLFGHLFRVEELGGELAEQQAKFGDTVEAMYVFADELLGEYMDAMDENTTLMVLSDHGFQLGALHDDPSRTRDLRRVSEKFHRIDGILYLYGAGVRAGAQIQGASILDITPTLLSFLGLPAADDMPGRVLEEAMSNPRPIDRIATYENAGGKGGGADGRQSARINQAQLEHLRSLGYIGGDGEPATTSTPGDRNLAAIHFEQGQYREAAQMFKRLVDEEPDNASLRASLAGALGALERYDLALEQLNRSIE
ncbi:MAG: alkaline phosphatase family protein, partial [Acidobacteriota bacterium]